LAVLSYLAQTPSYLSAGKDDRKSRSLAALGMTGKASLGMTGKAAVGMTG
jgi:hypothetical protein